MKILVILLLVCRYSAEESPSIELALALDLSAPDLETTADFNWFAYKVRIVW